MSNLLFVLPIAMLITSELIDLIKINQLLEKRNLIVDLSNKTKDELATQDRSDLLNFVKIMTGVYFYYLVLIAGLFTHLIWFSVTMFIITFISSKFAAKFEKDPKNFANYFIVDKSLSVAIFIGALLYHYANYHVN